MGKRRLWIPLSTVWKPLRFPALLSRKLRLERNLLTNIPWQVNGRAENGTQREGPFIAELRCKYYCPWDWLHKDQ
jgi:hypothetical protein